MKRLIVAIGIAVLFVTQVSAVSQGPGGIVYWNNSVARSGGGLTKFRLYETALSSTWTAGVVANFDNVDFNNTYVSWTTSQKNNMVEVWDPRELGGQGRLLMSSVVNNTPPSSGFTGSSYTQPWDFLAIDPITKVHTLLSDGRLRQYPNWHSQYRGKLLAAPENWLGTSNGLSFVSVTGIWSSEFSVVYDANGNGVIDNTTSEGKWMVYDYPAGSTYDAEMGKDKALYYTTQGYSPSKYVINRAFGASPDTSKMQRYFTVGGGGNPVGLPSDGQGIAVNNAASHPIVYYMAQDNVIVDGSPTYRDAIFALRDGDGDNVVTPGNANDLIVKIWRRGDFGLNNLHSIDINSYGEDLEYWQAPDNSTKKFLLGNGYSGYLFALELADNGLAALGGKYIFGNGTGPSNSSSVGFELDMEPGAAIPEPATMLLLGTGAMGVIGWMRRRRIK